MWENIGERANDVASQEAIISERDHNEARQDKSKESNSKKWINFGLNPKGRGQVP
jgi:hypothetical protein